MSYKSKVFYSFMLIPLFLFSIFIYTPHSLSQLINQPYGGFVTIPFSSPCYSPRFSGFPGQIYYLFDYVKKVSIPLVYFPHLHSTPKFGIGKLYYAPPVTGNYEVGIYSTVPIECLLAPPAPPIPPVPSTPPLAFFPKLRGTSLPSF